MNKPSENSAEDSPQRKNSTRDEATISQCQIEKLPRELVWKIVGYAPESVFNLKLTSKLLRSRVIEFAMEQDTLGLVKSLEIDRSKDNAREVVKLLVRNRHRSLFALRLKQRLLNKRVKRRTHTKFCEYQVELDCSLASDAELMGILKECVGPHVDKAIFRRYLRSSSNGLPTIYEHLKGIYFDYLQTNDINLSTPLMHALPSIVKEHKVEHFSLSVGEVSSDSIRGPRFHMRPFAEETSSNGFMEMLLQISSHVRSISLQQNNVYRSHNAYCFMGVPSVDWGQVIIDMFSKKMDKMTIVNPMFSQYLQRDTVDRLIEKLPTLGKKLSFEASCNEYDPSIYYTIHDHIVTAKISKTFGKSLSIKHISRKFEQYEF